jgi:hypothetical protein
VDELTLRRCKKIQILRRPSQVSFSTAIAANITEVVAVPILTNHTFLDQAGNFVKAQSQTLCHQIIKVPAEAKWSVQCSKQRSFLKVAFLNIPRRGRM